MLSAAASALLSSPALALVPGEIDTVQTTVMKTSTAGGTGTAANILIDAGGGINLKTTDPLITIDSNNTVTNNGTLTGAGEASAVGVLFNASGLSGSYSGTGTLDLTGSGGSKVGFHVGGTSSFTGNIAIGSGSTGAVNIVGDSSTGILIDPSATLNGDLALGGAFSMAPTTANEGSSSGVVIANLGGTINGSVNVLAGATYSAVGNNAIGFILSGPIKAVSATDIGSFVNNGTITVGGVSVHSTTGTNASSGSALMVENSIAGGIVNDGPRFAGDVTATASIVANGISVSAPTVLIAPVASGSNLQIGTVTNDPVNSTFSFINRGGITASPEDLNDDAHAVHISGADATANVIFAGGMINSGTITATAGSATKGSTASGVTALALQIDNFVTLPLIKLSSQATSAGVIAASINGPSGGTAVAISIAGTSTHVPEIDLDAGSTIAAVANVNDPSLIGVHLTAVAVEDTSGSLNKIENSGTISATAATLTNGNTAQTVAVSVAANTTGVTFDNFGKVTGDVLFGSGSDTFNVIGVPPPTGQTATAFVSGRIDFGISGSGTFDTLHVGQFANVAGTITSEGDLNVAVDQHGVLAVQNIVTSPQTALQVHDLIVAAGGPSSAGTLNLTVSEGAGQNAVINASHTVTLGSGTNLSVAFGSLLSGSGGVFNLIQTPLGGLSIDPADLARYNTSIGSDATRPFLFQDASLTLNHTASNDQLLLHVDVKTAAQLGLTGYAKAMFSLANAAIVNDQTLGSALISGITNATQAQAAYDAFAPEVSGGTRAIAISLTDQATGPVAARLRALRLFAKEPGELTMWGTEYGEYMSTHGGTAKLDAAGVGPVDGFKDRGFGFSLGLDEGAPGGWYGAAFSFYSGDVADLGDRNAKTNSLWYMLTGYNTWRGRALFVDTEVNLGYANIKGKRILTLTVPASSTAPELTFTREADNKHAGEFASLGLTMGAMLKFGGLSAIPQISLDAMTLREEGYTESNGGVGMNLTVNPYYANSARAFLGTEFKGDLNLGDFYLQPAARLGYRFDFLDDPVKLRAAFADTNPTQSGNQPGTPFTLEGPDPSRANVVLGASLNATTESWTIGLNYDFVRGSHNATEQVGTVSLLGRI